MTEKEKFIISTSNDIQSLSVDCLTSLMEQHIVDDAERVDIKLSFYSIMEFNALFYTYFDMLLFSKNLHQYRSVFYSSFFDTCKYNSLLWNKELTIQYFDSLIEEMAVIIKDLMNKEKFAPRVISFSRRILFTLKNDIPFDKELYYIKANAFDVLFLSLFIPEYITIVLEGANFFIKQLQE